MSARSAPRSPAGNGACWCSRHKRETAASSSSMPFVGFMEVIIPDNTPASGQSRDPGPEGQDPSAGTRASNLRRHSSGDANRALPPKLASRASGCVMRDPGFERLL